MFRTTLVFLAAVGAIAQAADYAAAVQQKLREVDAVVAKGPFRADWNSLSNFEAPKWYADAKFGIFIHWGAYSVPAYGNEWYPRNMYLEGSDVFKHHVATFGPQSKFGYKDFIPKFRAERFDPEPWALLFKRAGAKFVMPVAEHHDGFPMYDCGFTDWSASRMGPKRDIVGALAAAVRKNGMRFAASSHRAEHWWFYDGGMKFDSDVRDPSNAGLYAPAQPRETADKKQNPPSTEFMDDWLARTTELVDKYKPEVLWFDWWIEQPVFQPYLQRFAAFYYNRGAEWNKGGVAINYKNQSFPDKAAVLDIERGKLDKMRPLLWQTDTSISLKSWGYIDNDEFRKPDSIVDELVDIASKNGVLLLNIGPRPDGTIPEGAQETLLAIGKWLAANGEAVYGTRPWKVYGEGPTQVLTGGFTDRKQKPFTEGDIRFTQNGNNLYAIFLGWPSGATTIHSISAGALGEKKIASVSLVGARDKIVWKLGDEGLAVTWPGIKSGDYAHALRITLK